MQKYYYPTGGGDKTLERRYGHKKQKNLTIRITNSPEATNSILERIASIESKLTCMMQLQHPPNNIVINPCLSSSHLNKQSQTVATQTEAAPIESDGCSVTIPLTQSVPDVCSPQSLNNSEPTVCDNSTSQAPASL